MLYNKQKYYIKTKDNQLSRPIFFSTLWGRRPTQCQVFTVSAILSAGLDVNTAGEVKNKTLVRTVVLLETPKGVCNVSFSRLFPPYLLTSTSPNHPTSIFRRINPLFFFLSWEKVGYLSQQIPKSSFEISKKLLYWQWTLGRPLRPLWCTVEFEGPWLGR